MLDVESLVMDGIETSKREAEWDDVELWPTLSPDSPQSAAAEKATPAFMLQWNRSGAQGNSGCVSAAGALQRQVPTRTVHSPGPFSAPQP